MVAATHLGRVARSLALDALAARATVALSSAGIDCVLLKGPATVHWLYADEPGVRGYCDVDLLVDPRRWSAAGRVLAELGLGDTQSGWRASEIARLYEGTWTGGVGQVVDLHRGFHWVGDAQAFWGEVRSRAVPLSVGGTVVRIPSADCAALLYSLHAAADGGRSDRRKPLIDLRRSVLRFDDEVWREAAALATRVDAAEGFAVGLALTPCGTKLLDRLKLTAAAPAEIWLSATTPVHCGDYWFVNALGAAGWPARLRLVRDALLPSPAFMRGLVPWARRSDATLVLAYLYRLCLVPALLPRTLLNWGAARRLERGPRGSANRLAVPRRVWVLGAGARLLARPDRARVTTLLWTLRALRAVRTQLRSMPPGDVRLPVLRHESVGAPEVMRARAGTVRVVLRACGATCLEACVVRQTWLAAAGVRRDVIVGVIMPASGFRAHAWLDGDRIPLRFDELTRYPAAG